MIKPILIRRSGDSREPSQQEALELPNIPDAIADSELLWLDLESPTKEELSRVEARFALDTYAIEDVLQGGQRAKIEEYKGNVFCVIHIPEINKKKKGGAREQQLDIVEVFVFFGERWVITVHNREAEIIQNVDARLRARGLAPLTEEPSSDLFFYVFLDFAVDAFYPILDEMQEEIQRLEQQAVDVFETKRKRLANLSQIMAMMSGVRKKIDRLRREISPTRDLLGVVMRGSVPFVADSSLRNFRDIYDHSFQLVETIDSYRDRTSDVRDLYISLLAASTDNIMKLLTIVATVLLPLTLLSGIYGMNFTPGFFQPGSGVWYGFYVLMGAMVAIALGLALMFRRAGWI